MKKYYILKDESKIICENCEIANNPFSRFMGLMFRKQLLDGYGLLLDPCNQIHMFNMRFALDILFIDEDDNIVEILDSIKPWRVSRLYKNAKKVVELPAGYAKKMSLTTGTHLEFVTK